jgi:hypothetical protein
MMKDGVLMLEEFMKEETNWPGAFVDSHRGFGIPVTPDELRRVNEHHGADEQLLRSPGLQYVSDGKNKDGSWTYDTFSKQVSELLDVDEILHPQHQIVIEVDHSTNHL